MIARYSRPEMRAIWTDENKLRIWLQIELLASEALVKERIVPAEDFKRLKGGAEKWLVDLPGLAARQKELEKLRNHDVIAFTRSRRRKSQSSRQPLVPFRTHKQRHRRYRVCRADGAERGHSHPPMWSKLLPVIRRRAE
jgi:adenylosuccinate lyase